MAPLRLWPIGDEIEQAAKEDESFKERMLRKTAEALKRNRELGEKVNVE
jgi:hypothetical protein